MNPKEQPEPEPEPAFQLPQPPPGIEWHRINGWKDDYLPQGYRPLCADEATQSSVDEYRCDVEVDNFDGQLGSNKRPQGSAGFWRTTRPLTFTHLGKTWTWHKAGDPMPCSSKSKVYVLLTGDTPSTAAIDLLAAVVPWMLDPKIIGWRYAEPATKTVDLGPEDVPPGSVFRCSQWSYSKCWLNVRSVRDNGVELTNDFGWVTWHNLAEGFQINRPANRDADGYPTKWEPCSKEVPA